MQRRFYFCFLIMLSAAAHSATVISRDNSRHEGVIVEDNADAVKLKVKMGTLEALVTVPRADILEIQNTPARVNPIEAQAKELLNDAEFAMKTRNLKEAAAAWARLGALYQSEAGYSSKAKEAFENAQAFDPQNTPVPPRPRAVLTVVAAGDDARIDAAPRKSSALPVVQSIPDSEGDVLSAHDARRDRAVRDLLSTPLNTTPVCTPEFDAPYPARSGTYSYLNSCNDDYRAQRHAANCSPNRFAIFPYSVHVPGVSVTSSSPTYVVGGSYNYPSQCYPPAQQQQNHAGRPANFTPVNSQPSTITPPSTRPAPPAVAPSRF